MRVPSFTRLCGGLLATLLARSAVCAPAAWSGTALAERASTSRLVFAHFIVGIVSDRTGPSDYDGDFTRAASMGIDAMALNIGVDPFTNQQLDYAYQSAANLGFKVFISFDFNWWHPNNATQMGQTIALYANRTAQLMYNNAAFVSTFSGDGLDPAVVRSSAGLPIFFVPNFHPGQSNFTGIDGAFNWLGWPSNGNNKAPTPGANVTVEAGDAQYIAALAGKPYMAPASPWFFTHYGPEVSYSKNWVFPSDLLWYNRWNELLALGPQFVEIATWNDYGESHYVGPLDSPHYDDGASKWVNDMPHDGWIDMAKPFIAAYKDGAASPNAYINTDQLVYWYRPQPSTVNCDATDTTLQPANNASGNYFEGRPNGWQDDADAVFVVALLCSPGIVHVNSGNITTTFNAPAGATAYQVPMGIGKQSFALERNGAIVLGTTSLKDIIDGCVCGLYNYNAYVGTVPQGAPFPDQLGPAGIGSLTIGLHVSTCAATPSLGTSTLPYPSMTSVSATTTGVSSSSRSTSASSTVTSSRSTSASSTATSSRSTSASSTATSSRSTSASSTVTSSRSTSASSTATSSRSTSASSTATSSRSTSASSSATSSRSTSASSTATSSRSTSTSSTSVSSRPTSVSAPSTSSRPTVSISTSSLPRPTTPSSTSTSARSTVASSTSRSSLPASTSGASSSSSRTGITSVRTYYPTGSYYGYPPESYNHGPGGWPWSHTYTECRVTTICS